MYIMSLSETHICTLCPYQRPTYVHYVPIWDPHMYIMSLSETHICTLCPYQRPTYYVHIWDPHMYIMSLSGTHICTLCPYLGPTYVHYVPIRDPHMYIMSLSGTHIMYKQFIHTCVCFQTVPRIATCCIECMPVPRGTREEAIAM